MTKEEKNEPEEDVVQSEPDDEKETADETEDNTEDFETLKKSLAEANDKYIRLYADFDNYKKVAARNKEELLKYANEEIITDILTVIDHLELALQHSPEKETSDSLAEGVQLTLKELKSVLEKHGLVTIDALGNPFDPSVHHAMSKIETEGAEENTVVKEFRKGYKLKDRVLRAALVGVAGKTSDPGRSDKESPENQSVPSEE